jgi:outer membrane protein assembly factor BamE (lipoprotein component of BamABCDE complex)
MKLKQLILLFGIMIGLAGCSVQSQLVREYKGKTQEELMLQMGRPTQVETLSGGRKINIYEKSKFLKAATINTGQFQYDRFESPKAVKNEVFKFYFNSQGVVDDVKYEVSYGR